MTAPVSKPQRPQPGPKRRHRRTLEVRYGEDPVLEIAALEILMEDRRKGPNTFAAKQFWLTPEQFDRRHEREIHNKNGVADPARWRGECFSARTTRG